MTSGSELANVSLTTHHKVLFRGSQMVVEKHERRKRTTDFTLLLPATEFLIQNFLFYLVFWWARGPHLTKQLQIRLEPTVSQQGFPESDWSTPAHNA